MWGLGVGEGVGIICEGLVVDEGLVHGSGGKPSNRKTAEDIRSRVIEQYRLRTAISGRPSRLKSWRRRKGYG
jgi:hypothetical protein